MKRRKTIALTLVAGLAMAASCAVEKGQETVPGTEPKMGAETKRQTLCPVMGGKIDPKLYVDANGKRIYVCCQGCIGTVKSDPAKYIKELEADGIAVDDTPAAAAAAEPDPAGRY